MISHLAKLFSSHGAGCLELPDISLCGIPFCYSSDVTNFNVSLFGVLVTTRNGLLINLFFFVLFLLGNKRNSAAKCYLHLWPTRNAYHSCRGQLHLNAGINI